MSEFKQVFPAVLYFAIVFNLIHFTTGLTLPPGEVRFFSYGSVTLFALVMGKVLLIVNHFSFINAFPHKPLIYNITWKFFLYGFAAVLFWAVEDFFVLTRKYASVDLAWERIYEDLLSHVFWSSLTWLLLTLLIYIIFTEFAHALGRARVLKLLFG